MVDLIALIKRNAELNPASIAVIDGERKYSYAEFIKCMNVISHQLIKYSEKPKIILDLKQGFEAYVTIVAILNVGGTYCPLNPDSPVERKKQIIEEFKPDVIIIEDSKNIETELNSFVTVKVSDILGGDDFSEIQLAYDQDDIIYIIYTSGTTGMPKGVMIYRKALNKFLEWAIPTYAANENDIWGQFSFLSFDLSIVDIFTCLCSGATLFAMNDIPAKKNRPAGIIEKEKITVWHSIPSAIEFMIVNERSKVYDFSSLRLMTFCGEPLKKHQIEFLFKKKENLIIFNTYGPTEGTLFCTWQELTCANYIDHCDFTLSIGKAIPGWNLKLKPVEDSTEKEVIIYGDYIGKGYLSTIVDEKFKIIEIDNKLVNSFETGDLVNEKNGDLYFSSRKDRQVKIKGFRIELDEIDFRINEFLNKPCVTAVKKDALYSFIESDDKIDEPSLREFLKSKMEIYKVPNAFYVIKTIPRSQNQKVDLKALIELIT